MWVQGARTPRDAVTPRSTPRHQLQKYIDMVEKLEKELDDQRYSNETLSSDLDAKKAEYDQLNKTHEQLISDAEAMKQKIVSA